MSILRPVPTGIENKLPPDKLIVSKTDPSGGIVSVSQTFTEISGYKESELITSAHSLLRHPDMPKVIFKIMWNRLNRGQGVKAVIKNLTKCGNHYWSLTSIEVKKDRESETVRNYIAYRSPINNRVKEEIESLYKLLREVEGNHSVEDAVNFLEGYLDERRVNYDEYMEQLEETAKIQGIMDAIKKIF